MSTAIAKNFQVGNDSTATNNFTIRQPATPDGTVRIANGNTGTTTDLVTVTSAGNVGIGTSSPSNATLDVVANANTVALAVRGRSSDNLSGIVFRSNNAATEYAYLQGGPTYLAVGVNAAERMRVDGSGNLMIGGTTAYGKTTSYTNFGNSYGSSYTARALGTAQGQLAGYSFNPTFQGTADNVPRRAADIWSGFNSGAWGTEFLAFGVGTGAGAANDAGNVTTERMRITVSGNVGIGTSSPVGRLDVVNPTTPYVNITATGATTAAVLCLNATSGSAEAITYQQALRFGSATGANAAGFTERARIDSSGNLQVQTGAVVVYQPTPASIATTATLTNANIQTGIINTTGTSYTVTMPLGTTLETLVTWAAINLGYDFSIINTASGTITMAANTGVSTFGAMTIDTGTSAQFRIRRTAANTFVMYRLS